MRRSRAELYRLALLRVATDPAKPTRDERMTAHALVKLARRSWRVQIALAPNGAPDGD